MAAPPYRLRISTKLPSAGDRVRCQDPEPPALSNVCAWFALLVRPPAQATLTCLLHLPPSILHRQYMFFDVWMPAACHPFCYISLSLCCNADRQVGGECMLMRRGASMAISSI